jgi:hypothetical protein
MTLDEIIDKWIAADYQMSSLTWAERRMLEDELSKMEADGAAQWARQPAGN